MHNKLKLLQPLAAALFLACVTACGSDNDTASTEDTDLAPPRAATVDRGPDTDSALPRRPEGVLPPEPTASANHVIVGSSIGPEGAAQPATGTFSLTDTIYASAPVAEVPADARVSVYWTYEDGNSHKEETIAVPAGDDHVVFEFSQADGMQAGDYNVQIDANMQPIGIAEFRVE